MRHPFVAFNSPKGEEVTAKDIDQAKKAVVVQAKKQATDYMLGSCEEAVRAKDPAGHISYWLCYSHPGPIFEATSKYKALKKEGAEKDVIETHKTHHQFGGAYWHAVLVKFHNEEVCVLPVLSAA